MFDTESLELLKNQLDNIIELRGLEREIPNEDKIFESSNGVHDSYWQIIQQKLIEKGYLYNLEYLKNIYDIKPDDINENLILLFKFINDKPEIINIYMPNSNKRKIIHIAAEAMDIVHISSTIWTKPTKGNYTPKCNICTIKKSEEENKTTGITLSKIPIKTRKRDRRHRQEAYEKNCNYNKSLNIKCKALKWNNYMK